MKKTKPTPLNIILDGRPPNYKSWLRHWPHSETEGCGLGWLRGEGSEDSRMVACGRVARGRQAMVRERDVGHSQGAAAQSGEAKRSATVPRGRSRAGAGRAWPRNPDDRGLRQAVFRVQGCSKTFQFLATLNEVLTPKNCANHKTITSGFQGMFVSRHS